MNSLIKDVVIVGGGTAGWITAALLAKKQNLLDRPDFKITLIESPEIPILGVGEGTWPTIRNTLYEIGIGEDEFIRECDASFKQGAEFVNWYESPDKIGRHSYVHPLNATFHAAYDLNLAPYWLLEQEEGRLPYDQAVASQVRISLKGLAPKLITTQQYQGLLNYSYHLDATKFAQLLKKHAQRLGVNYIAANVNDVQLDTAGNISSVITDKVGQISGDLFIDCSGSRALLLGEALGVKWHNINDIIFNDKALAVQVPYEREDSPIASNTIATAHKHGWTWDIGLQSRRGIGYVYSSSHCDDATAEHTLRQYIGTSSDNLTFRQLKFNLGYRDKFWHRNCVAVGMSAAFIEPLEASAIFLTEAAVNMIADQFPSHFSDLDHVAKKFNETFAMRWRKSIDFIKLHYCISQREDTSYWLDNRSQHTIPESLRENLAHWRNHIPSKYDFENAFEPFVLDSYLFVLYGLKYPTELIDGKALFSNTALAARKFAEISNFAEKLSQTMPTNRELLKKIQQFGLSKI